MGSQLESILTKIVQLSIWNRSLGKRTERHVPSSLIEIGLSKRSQLFGMVAKNVTMSKMGAHREVVLTH